MDRDEITREQFEQYRSLQEFGIINMLDVKNGTELTGLSSDEYITIIKNYNYLCQKYTEE